MPHFIKPFIVLLSMSISLSATAQDPAGKYPFTSTRELNVADVSAIDPSELKIMRNEIFARHGHTFKGEDLRQYFGSQPWYKASVADATSLLTPLEKRNAEFIKKYETKIASSSDFNLFYASFKKAVNEEDAEKLAEMMSHTGMFSSAEEFKELFMDKRVDIQIGIEKNRPKGDETIKKIFFGPYESGVQYKWVEFHKEGCCWVIYAFGMAG